MKTNLKLSLINKLGIYFVILSVAGFIFSCGGDKKQEKDASEEFDQAASELSNRVKKVIYEIPPPSEMPVLIQSTGASYNPDMSVALKRRKNIRQQ